MSYGSATGVQLNTWHSGYQAHLHNNIGSNNNNRHLDSEAPRKLPSTTTTATTTTTTTTTTTLGLGEDVVEDVGFVCAWPAKMGKMSMCLKKLYNLFCFL